LPSSRFRAGSFSAPDPDRIQYTTVVVTEGNASAADCQFTLCNNRVNSGGAVFYKGMMSVTLERTLFRLCQAGQRGGGFFCGSNALHVSSVCVIRCFACVQGHCLVSTSADHDLKETSLVGAIRTDQTIDFDSVTFERGLLMLSLMNWTGNRPSQRSAGYSAPKVGIVGVRWCHFELNDGAFLIRQGELAESRFDSCNFVRNRNKGSLLVMAGVTTIENSVFLGNDGKAITGPRGSREFRIVRSYSDTCVFVSGQEVMTINQSPRLPRNKSVRDTHESTLVLPSEGRFWVGFTAAGVIVLLLKLLSE
jgi:hypothetical protein